MDEEKIINELTAQKLNLTEKDPIFAAILLNKIILREYIAEFEENLTENITNVAIKEDVTFNKLKQLLSAAQLKNRQETERALNQFADNLQGKLYALLNQAHPNNNPGSWYWMLVFLVMGVVLGFISGKFLL